MKKSNLEKPTFEFKRSYEDESGKLVEKFKVTKWANRYYIDRSEYFVPNPFKGKIKHHRNAYFSLPFDEVKNLIQFLNQHTPKQES